MKAFRNPLERILEVRRLQQEQREAELFVALRERDRAREKLDAILASQQEAARYLPSARNAAPGSMLLARDRFVEHQRRRAGWQRQELGAAAAEVDSRQGVLVEARREVRTFETHRSRLHERWQADAQRHEQSQIDDLASARHVPERAAEADAEAESRTCFVSKRQVDGNAHG